MFTLVLQFGHPVYREFSAFFVFQAFIARVYFQDYFDFLCCLTREKDGTEFSKYIERSLIQTNKEEILGTHLDYIFGWRPREILQNSYTLY